jgi:hypothetical protein
MAFTISAPGFEAFLHDESVREGEKNVPVSKAADDEHQKQQSQAVIYEERKITPFEMEAGLTPPPSGSNSPQSSPATTVRDHKWTTARSDAIHLMQERAARKFTLNRMAGG